MFFADTEEQISWAAHVGGIVAGAVLVILLKRRDVPLFDREIKPPHAVEVEGKDQIRWGRGTSA